MLRSATSLVSQDKKYVWHPFTQMREWNSPEFEAIVIVGGKGAELFDARGRRYLDGNSSIWTNLHGHRHPAIDGAIRKQLGRIAHTSFLGLTNDVAVCLATELVKSVAAPKKRYRVFFSDDGSTAMEAALKMALQARFQRGETKRNRFVSLDRAYHGDTVGAMSLSHQALFHKPFESVIFKTESIAPPFCYRCPFNRAKPQRGVDQRESRRCGMECQEQMRQALDNRSGTIAALVMEPLVQGTAGMVMHPRGFLRKAAKLCRERGIWLILDEVMTGFGRTGSLYACQRESVAPDFLALAKGLSGGYLPVAATLVTGEVFEAFLGEPAEFKTFFHGHSYTGNPLGCAAGLANLDIFRRRRVLAGLGRKQEWLRRDTQVFWRHPQVGDVRQEGMICAIELVQDVTTREPFPLEARHGFRVCQAARRHGLLTRPIGDVLMLMPPYCSTRQQIREMVSALWRGLCDVLPTGNPKSV